LSSGSPARARCFNGTNAEWSTFYFPSPFVLLCIYQYLFIVTSKLLQRVTNRLEEIEAKGLRRELRPPFGVDLSSNDYLGLSQHPRLKQAMTEAVMLEGCGATASRLLRGERECFAAIEKRFARFKKTERALFFGSGYAANVGALTTFLEEGDVVFTDELNHASLIDGIRLSKAQRVIFHHCNIEALNRAIFETSCDGQRFLVTESLFSMNGDIAPLREYARVCRESDMELIVDEAHAVGVYGERGSGLIENFKLDEDVFLSINTCGKALGVCGAFAAGPAWAIEYLVQRARPFIFSTAPPPAVAAALNAALDVIEEEPETRAKLLSLARVLRGALREKGIEIPVGQSQIISIIIGESEKVVEIASKLQAEGFDARAIRPPTVPEGTARLRVSVNVGLDEETLLRFASSVKKAMGETYNVSANLDSE
jgi:8-amino-7-oxononanoate synthase